MKWLGLAPVLVLLVAGCGDDGGSSGDSDAAQRDATSAPQRDAASEREAGLDAAVADAAVDSAAPLDPFDASSIDASGDVDAQSADAEVGDADAADAGLVCIAPLADCNADIADGCEVNTSASVQHCGGCNSPCARANATTQCSNATCAIAACSPGFRDCNGNAADGCEINVTNNASHCGGCFAQCAVANGTPLCSGQTCGVASCAPGFANCDGNPSNGCEVNTRSNRAHCGGCNQPCPGNMACANSLCVP